MLCLDDRFGGTRSPCSRSPPVRPATRRQGRAATSSSGWRPPPCSSAPGFPRGPRRSTRAPSSGPTKTNTSAPGASRSRCRSSAAASRRAAAARTVTPWSASSTARWPASPIPATTTTLSDGMACVPRSSAAACGSTAIARRALRLARADGRGQVSRRYPVGDRGTPQPEAYEGPLQQGPQATDHLRDHPGNVAAAAPVARSDTRRTHGQRNDSGGPPLNGHSRSRGPHAPCIPHCRRRRGNRGWRAHARQRPGRPADRPAHEGRRHQGGDGLSGQQGHRIFRRQ